MTAFPNMWGYKIIGRVGYKTQRQVLLAKDSLNGNLVALKESDEAEPQHNRATLKNEMTHLRKLGNYFGVPWVIDYRTSQGGNSDAFIMELLGANLFELADLCGGRLTEFATLKIGEQAVSILEVLQQNGILHRNISPDNLLIGRCYKNDCHVVYLIDFETATSAPKPNTTEFQPENGAGKQYGSRVFCSFSASQCLGLSFRDDLESLGYTLAFLLNGRLPWSDVESVEEAKVDRKCSAFKRPELIDGLYDQSPGWLTEFVQYSRSLTFHEVPDYNKLRQLMLNQKAVLERKDDSLMHVWHQYAWHRQKHQF